MGRNFGPSDCNGIDRVEAYKGHVPSLEDSKENDSKSRKQKEPDSDELADDKKSSVTTLTFNFIYYLIYKFKPAEVL